MPRLAVPPPPVQHFGQTHPISAGEVAEPGTTIEEFDNSGDDTDQEAEQLLDSGSETVFAGPDDYAYPDYESTDDEDQTNADEIFDELGQSGGGEPPLTQSLGVGAIKRSC